MTEMKNALKPLGVGNYDRDEKWCFNASWRLKGLIGDDRFDDGEVVLKMTVDTHTWIVSFNLLFK